MLLCLEVRQGCHENVKLHHIDSDPGEGELEREQIARFVADKACAVPPFRAVFMAKELISHTPVRDTG